MNYHKGFNWRWSSQSNGQLTTPRTDPSFDFLTCFTNCAFSNLNNFLIRLWGCLLHCLFSFCLGGLSRTISMILKGLTVIFMLYIKFCVTFFWIPLPLLNYYLYSSYCDGLPNFERNFFMCDLGFSFLTQSQRRTKCT